MLENSTYLEIKVGPYELAIPATSVAIVAQDVDVSDIIAQSHQHPTITVRDQAFPFVDLLTFFGGPPRSIAPFLVGVESEDLSFAVGVDRITHVHQGQAEKLAVPGFGLRYPKLFSHALRNHQRLLLLVHLPSLGQTII